MDKNCEKTILLLDDDTVFLKRLSQAMMKRGFSVEVAETITSAKEIAKTSAPGFAVLDLRLADGNGLEVVQTLRESRPDCRILILTGYGAISTAVSAVKLGATDYLSKPADADEIIAALMSQSGTFPPIPETFMSPNAVRWEHIQRVFEMCNRNTSETARQLNMHRRTLQRVLAKRRPV